MSESNRLFVTSPSPHDRGEPLHDGDGDGESAITIARKIHRMESQHIDHRTINAIPGADIGQRSRVGSLVPASRVPIATLVTNPLPDEHTMVTLIDEYFKSVHWFSLVILEAKFRLSFDVVRHGFASPSEKPFLLLLSTMLGLAAWYRGNVPHPRDGHPPKFWQEWSTSLIANSESQIIDIMNRNSVTAVQTLILLGSFYVYHGRPNLSFSLLGATVKAAQAAGLHRESSHGSQADQEEKKRVWWTIYTWDRFAAITYGRPLGISDKDCNISQPGDVFEDTSFADGAVSEGAESVCFSAYQRELNWLYLIASPAIESIYSAPNPEQSSGVLGNLTVVKDVTMRLWRWRRRLPQELRPSLDNDCPPNLANGARAHRLQSLSLQLTFDSLIIVLHRPFIKQRFNFNEVHVPRQQSFDASSSAREHTSPSISSDSSFELDMSSQQQWWDAAVRTSRVTELPQLAQIATDGHLVAFLAINLFNAAMVMVVVALSDPLTNNAQEAKRAVARIYRLQESLGSRSTLSKQSSRVLQSLVHLLLRRETEAILAPTGNQPSSEPTAEQKDGSRMSVRDALSMPLRADLTQEQADVCLDQTSGLDHGLSTVQRVFTYGSINGFGDVAYVGNERSISDVNQFPQLANGVGSYNTLGENFSTVSEWNDGNIAGNSGLYWFWDPSWDDLYTNSGIEAHQ